MMKERFEKKTLKKNNDKEAQYYIEGQQVSIEADFLLIAESKQTEILKNFKQPDLATLLKDISISQLWTLELLILRSLNTNDLMRRVWIVREKFKSQFGDDIYQRYHNSLPSVLQDTALASNESLTKENVELLFDDTVNIARQMQRMAYNRIRRSESVSERKRVVIWCAIATFVIGAAVFGILKHEEFAKQLMQIYTCNGRESAKFLLLIIGSGITGTVISLLQRIEKATNVPPTITDSVHDATCITLSMSNWYIVSMIVCGAVFALLVNFISVAGLVNILGILPVSADINTGECPDDYDPSLLLQLILPPNNKADIAKLLLICFLSGFAERLMPDILDNLAKKTDEKLSK